MRHGVIFQLTITAVLAGGLSAQERLQPAIPQRAEIDARGSRSAPETLRPRSAGKNVRLLRRKDGSVASASGFAARAYAGTPAEAAIAFLRENQDLLGQIPAENLRHVQTRQIGARRYVRFQQEFGGVPIRRAQVVVQVTNANTVESLSSTLQSDAKAAGEWRIPATAAAESAVAAHRSAPSKPPETERLYLGRDGRLSPVWRVLFRSADPPGDWEYLVSAEDGRVLDKQNLRSGAVGSRALGMVYPENPAKGNRERVSLENFVSDTSLTSSQTQVFTHHPALRGQVPPGTVVQGAARQQDGNFLYDADDARASEVQLYYGMEAANARFQALGFWGFSEPLPGVVFYQDWDEKNSRFVGADNAFFSPVAFGKDKGGMFFYLTSRNADTSLDTDVIFHEYTHAVVNELVGPNQSATFKALNEGTADYFANSFQNDPIMAEYAAKVFNLRTPFLRRTDNTNSWPYNTVGEPHADGNVWSGALWEIRRLLGAPAADDIAINAVAMLTPDAEFFDAAAAAIDAADTLYGSRAADAVAGVMQARGIYTRAAETASQAQWLDSGSSADGSISGARPGYVLVGEQQYRIEVPNRATKLLIRARASSSVKFYIRYRVPVTVENGEIQAEQMSPAGTDPAGFLSLDNTPELQAGVYYIAAVNTTQSPVDYTIFGQVEGGEPGPIPAVTLIENGGTARGSVPSGPFLASRQFAVQVPEGATALSITLDGDQDVDLYVRFGAVVYVNGMGYPQGDLVSNTADSREYMRITGSNGGALPAGIYVIGVYNYSWNTATFQVSARIE